MGMELDTDKVDIRLPEDKLWDIKALLQIWHEKKAYRKRESFSAQPCLQSSPDREIFPINESTKAKQLEHFYD